MIGVGKDGQDDDAGPSGPRAPGQKQADLPVQTGVFIENGSNNTIGGSRIGANMISGNSVGVCIWGDNGVAAGNDVRYNWIGPGFPRPPWPEQYELRCSLAQC